MYKGSSIGEADLSITVVSGSVVAIIARKNESIVSTRVDLVIDGSTSYDTNDGSPVSRYDWTCIDRNSGLGCQDTDGNALISESTVGKLVLPARKLIPGSRILFKLTVSKDSRTDEDFVSFYMVDAKPELIPIPQPTWRQTISKELIL